LTLAGLLTLALPALAAPPIDPRVVHAVNRLSFGPRPGELERVQAMGVERYIQEQLSPEALPESETVAIKLAALSTLNMGPEDLFRAFGPDRSAAMARRTDRQAMEDGNAPLPDVSNTQRQRLAAGLMRARAVVQDATAARLMRAVESPRQLDELMVDFWFNHFNVFAGKGLTRLWVGAYEQQAIRPHTLGRFRDLVLATARHPAMLFYLDNWQNTGPGTPGARGRFKGLNENYARELMELHTLGVDGGYSQKDVTELARIFTGWGLCPGRRGGGDGSGFCFDRRRHDRGDKVLLGQAIRGGGEEEGLQAIDLLVRHPATARHISYQLAQYFVADAPPAALVERLTKRFQETDGDIRAVLATLFKSPEFWDPVHYGAKFRTPLQYVVAALRVADTPLPEPRAVAFTLQQLGQPFYGCQTPDGYKNTRDAWLSPEGMTTRLNFATALAEGKVPGSHTRTLARLGDQEIPDDGVILPPEVPTRPVRTAGPLDAEALQRTLGNRFSTKTAEALRRADPALRAALILGSPELMSR
jgi:uncharacterized protein (DUF1800 family)